jgi:purine-binding chemotaxis protein CheW
MNDKDHDTTETRRQFITFVLGGQEFGANIMTIREIRGWTETTMLPHSPDFVRGVINLRGVVLPVVDLKARLGRGLTEANLKNVIIVVKSGERTIGLLVDAVSDILTATAADIQPTPELARDQGNAFVEGIAVLDARMVTLLSMEKLIASLVGDAPSLAEAA